jgi:hypothetical protein
LLLQLRTVNTAVTPEVNLWNLSVTSENTEAIQGRADNWKVIRHESRSPRSITVPSVDKSVRDLCVMYG